MSNAMQRNSQRRRSLATMEALPPRAMLSAVAWIGAGDGVNWSDPANWSINAMPQASDDVTINVAANPNIVVTGNRSVNSLNNSEPLTLSGGGTLTVATTASSNQNIKLNGGTISGGTWNFAAGAGFNVGNAANNINGATINGDLFLTTNQAHTKVDSGTTFTTAHLGADGTSIGFALGSTITGTVLLEGSDTAGRYLEMNGQPGSLNIASTGAIKTAAGFAGSCNIGSVFWSGGAMTLNNSGTISAEVAGKSININGAVFNNSGTTRALNGSTLNIGATNWSNAATGTLSATGSTLVLNNAWSNLGSMSITNSTVTLGGSFSGSTFNYAAFSRSGGVVNLTGAMDNAGHNLVMNGGTGTWNLSNGTVSGGQLSYANGQLLALTQGGGTLNNVQVNGDLTADAFQAHVRIAGGTTFNTFHLAADGTSVGIEPGYTLNSAILFEGSGSQGRYVELSGNPGTFTIGPSGVIKGVAGFAGFGSVGQNFWYSSGMTLNNQGLISSEINGKSLNIGATVFNNQAMTRVINGATMNISCLNWSNTASGTLNANASTLALSGNWSNLGTFNDTNSVLTLDGTFSTSAFNFGGFSRSGGTVDLKGTVNNTGATLTLNNSTGAWNFKNATINGGQLSFADGKTLALSDVGGLLQNVTVNGDLYADAHFAHVKISNGTTFNAFHLVGDSASVGFESGYTLNGQVIFEGASTDVHYLELYGAPGTLTISPTGSVKTAPGFNGIANVGQNGWYGGTMTLVNNGLISSETAGKIMNVRPAGGLTVGGVVRAISGGILKIDTAGPVAVTPAGNVAANSFRSKSLTIDGAASVVPDAANADVSIINSLSIGASGYFDLNNNDLLINYTGASPKSAVQNLINLGRNGGAWNGVSAIRSGSAKNNPQHNTTLGLLEATEFKSVNGAGATFDGQTIDDTALLIKYTYYGDVDFSGTVDFDDYSRIDAGFNGNKTGWLNGDVDSNGVIDFDDYSLIDQAFNTQGGALRPAAGPTGIRLQSRVTQR